MALPEYNSVGISQRVVEEAARGVTLGSLGEGLAGQVNGEKVAMAADPSFASSGVKQIAIAGNGMQVPTANVVGGNVISENQEWSFLIDNNLTGSVDEFLFFGGLLGLKGVAASIGQPPNAADSATIKVRGVNGAGAAEFLSHLSVGSPLMVTTLRISTTDATQLIQNFDRFGIWPDGTTKAVEINLPAAERRIDFRVGYLDIVGMSEVLNPLNSLRYKVLAGKVVTITLRVSYIGDVAQMREV